MRLLGGTVLVLSAVSLLAVALPQSVFVVHCEPTNANEMMWQELVALVETADSFNVPLTIYFTPQWAGMILDDPQKLSTVEAWIATRHEIGCHHHGYWGTKERASTWDGYTNTPLDELDSADRDCFLGTMDEFMSMLNALPGERRSGCMGGSESNDVIDHPCQLEYSTQGHALEDVITAPETLARNGCDIIEIGHGLIASQPRGALRELYLATADDVIFGVVGHVYNFAEMPIQFIEWFRFLLEQDEARAFRSTVSDVLDAWRG